MKIFLAGSIEENIINEFLIAAPYRLQSMYFIKDWELQYIKHFEMFMLDSGAFSMIYKNKKKINFDNYVKKYIDFINKQDIQYFFELDIDPLVGLKKVEEYRDLINKETGKKCIPVWHRDRGIQYFKDCCKEYSYVSIGGMAVSEYENNFNLYQYLPYFISYAHHCKAKIHGLGFTRFSVLKDLHWDSVDSTSWLDCARFGSIKKLNYRNGNVESLNIENSKQIHHTNLRKMSLVEWKKIVEWYRCFA